MAALRALTQRLFERPGQRPSDTAALLAGAAACHHRFLNYVAAGEGPGGGDALNVLLAALAEDTNPDRTWPLLNHPLLVDALHSMATEVPELRAWDEMTVPPDPSGPTVDSAAHGREKLNNVARAFLLRRRPTWCGQLNLCTDALGFLRFPFSDWSLWLRTASDGHEEALGNTIVTVSLEPDSVCWSLPGDRVVPFLVMARRDCGRLVVTSDPRISLDQLAFPNPSVPAFCTQPRWVPQGSAMSLSASTTTASPPMRG